MTSPALDTPSRVAPIVFDAQVFREHAVSAGVCSEHDWKVAQEVAPLGQLVAQDLELSGYFRRIDRERYLVRSGGGLTLDEIDFGIWRLIDADRGRGLRPRHGCHRCGRTHR